MQAHAQAHAQSNIIFSFTFLCTISRYKLVLLLIFNVSSLNCFIYYIQFVFSLIMADLGPNIFSSDTPVVPSTNVVKEGWLFKRG